jgi:hypothetical protein
MCDFFYIHIDFASIRQPLIKLGFHSNYLGSIISVIYLYALFGCTEIIFKIESSENSKFMVESKLLTIQILIFGGLEFVVRIR